MSNLTWWWLSFADDSGFLGGALVVGETLPDAIQCAWFMCCNPGGEVKAMKLEAKTAEELLPYRPFRLYSKEQINKIDVAERF